MIDNVIVKLAAEHQRDLDEVDTKIFYEKYLAKCEEEGINPISRKGVRQGACSRLNLKIERRYIFKSKTEESK